MGFSKDFVWGAATASYQIEGAAYEGIKGLNVWDVCCKQDGFVKDGYTGDVACDHYHKYKEDVQIMKEIGIQAYRFSINWARVLPDGTGKVNEEGLDFYDKLVDELEANGIEPYVTLFHWDYPNELFKRGGWLNPDSPEWFAEYTRVIVDKLSDRVTHWLTLNEPQCFIGLGHESGIHAPGLKLNKGYVLQAAHNTLLTHGKAVQVIRQNSKKPCEIGFAPVGSVTMPATDSKEDLEIARKITFECNMDNGIWANSLWMDPVFFGTYPEDGMKSMERWWPSIGQNDMDLIHQPLDFFACNIYQGATVQSDGNVNFEYVKKSEGYPRTAITWPITDEVLYYGAKFFCERYNKPFLITENGMSNIDRMFLDGKVHDPVRIDFLTRYLKAYQRAADEGYPIKGYFQWSLMDNFEWAEGYNERFGMVYVDYPTGNRILKDSAYWYKDIIANNGII